MFQYTGGMVSTPTTCCGEQGVTCRGGALSKHLHPLQGGVSEEKAAVPALAWALVSAPVRVRARVGTQAVGHPAGSVPVANLRSCRQGCLHGGWGAAEEGRPWTRSSVWCECWDSRMVLGKVETHSQKILFGVCLLKTVTFLLRRISHNLKTIFKCTPQGHS